MSAVLKDVEQRHGGSAEAVDEECFEFTFGEVEGDERASQSLGACGRASSSGEEVRTNNV